MNHFTGKNMNDLCSNLKAAGYEMDSADRHSPQDKVTLYKDNQEFTATFNKYSDGGVEVLNIKANKSSDDSTQQPQQKADTTKDSKQTKPANKQSTGDAKQQLASMLASGKSREDIMAEFEKQGVTWKKNDHAGINWMRASMAIQKHLAGGSGTSTGNSSKTSSGTQYKTGSVDKDGTLKPSGNNEIQDMVEELTDLPDMTYLTKVTNDLVIPSGSSGIESAKVLSNGKLEVKVYLEGHDEISNKYIDDTFTVEVPVKKK
jgi:hypothetical protein